MVVTRKLKSYYTKDAVAVQVLIELDTAADIAASRDKEPSIQNNLDIWKGSSAHTAELLQSKYLTGCVNTLKLIHKMLASFDTALVEVEHFRGKNHLPDKPDCYVTLSKSEYLRRVTGLADALAIAGHNDVDLAALGARTTFDAGVNKTVEAYAATYKFCVDTQLVLSAAEQLRAALTRDLEIFNALTNYQVPAQVLAELDRAKCVPDAQFERTRVKSCDKYAEGLSCALQVVPLSAATDLHELLPVPFLVDDHLVSLDLKMARPVKKPGMTLLTDAHACDMDGHVLTCHSPLDLLPNQCLEFIYAKDIGGITEHCTFQELPLDAIPFIAEIAQGKTLVSQRSPDHPVAISLDSEGVYTDPVLVQYKSVLTISYGSTMRTFAGVPTNSDKVLTFLYNVSQREQFLGNVRVYHYLESNWVPDDLEELLTILSLVLQGILAIPCLVWFTNRCKRTARNETASASKPARSLVPNYIRKKLRKRKQRTSMCPNRRKREQAEGTVSVDEEQGEPDEIAALHVPVTHQPQIASAPKTSHDKARGQLLKTFRHTAK